MHKIVNEMVAKIMIIRRMETMIMMLMPMLCRTENKEMMWQYEVNENEEQDVDNQ